MPRLYIVPLLTLLLISPLIAAPLHYFREDDRVGLKDETGRVLVPARYPDRRGSAGRRNRIYHQHSSAACRRRCPGLGSG